MKAKLNYGALVDVVSMGGSTLQQPVAIPGAESLMQHADALYQTGNDDAAREAVREALRVAMLRLDAKYGTTAQQREEGTPVVNGVATDAAEY